MHMIPSYRWFMLATDFDGWTTRYMGVKVDTNGWSDGYILCRIV